MSRVRHLARCRPTALILQQIPASFSAQQRVKFVCLSFRRDRRCMTASDAEYGLCASSACAGAWQRGKVRVFLAFRTSPPHWGPSRVAGVGSDLQTFHWKRFCHTFAFFPTLKFICCRPSNILLTDRLNIMRIPPRIAVQSPPNELRTRGKGESKPGNLKFLILLVLTCISNYDGCCWFCVRLQHRYIGLQTTNPPSSIQCTPTVHIRDTK